MISFEIDMTTVLIFLFFGNLVTAGLLAIYSGESISHHAHRQFLAGKLLQSISWLLLAMRGKIPDVLSAHVGNSLLLAGFALEALALISVEKPRKQWETYYAIVVAVFIFVFWGFARQPNEYVYISSTFAAVIFLSVTTFFLRDSKKSTLRYSLSVIYTVSCLILLVRSMNAFLHADYKLMSSEFSQNLTFISTYFLMIISGSSFLLLQRERTDELLRVVNQELDQLAHIDGLTSLANRRKFSENLTYGILESRRRVEPLALIMADIDFFKKYNDHYGHIYGDRCLVQVAQELKRHCQRSTDLIARYGGEEFAVLLPDTDPSGLLTLAERLRSSVASMPVPYGEALISITASVGVSTMSSGGGCSLEAILDAADQALYAAKDAGRNRVSAVSTCS